MILRIALRGPRLTPDRGVGDSGSAAARVPPGRVETGSVRMERIGRMIRIRSRGNETAEQVLRRFKKACEKEGLTRDIRRIAHYEKPSEKRRCRLRNKPRLTPSR